MVRFREKFHEILDNFHGKWLEKIAQALPSCPTKKDFHLPKNQTEWEDLKNRMLGCGIAESSIKI